LPCLKPRRCIQTIHLTLLVEEDLDPGHGLHRDGRDVVVWLSLAGRCFEVDQLEEIPTGIRTAQCAAERVILR
jgi:hypothetical protein